MRQTSFLFDIIIYLRNRSLLNLHKRKNLKMVEIQDHSSN
jgi:hypothetical protein